MIRKKLILALLKNRAEKIYLEIGVSTGRVFFDIKSKTKFAVDPLFKISAFKRFRRTVKNPLNIFADFYPMTSDAFFASEAAELFKNKKIDVCLVDGMHEYEYALRDMENAVKYLKDDGVIIVHDCNPITREKAGTFKEWESRNFAGEWNGDVWKAIVYLRSQRKDINVFVLDCDYGLGIITKGHPESMLNIRPEQVSSLTYEEFNTNRSSWLNLKKPEYFNEYMKAKGLQFADVNFSS